LLSSLDLNTFTGKAPTGNADRQRGRATRAERWREKKRKNEKNGKEKKKEISGFKSETA